MAQQNKKVSKVSVDYRLGSNKKCCGNCDMYTADSNRPTQGTCSLVRGVILPNMVCDEWDGK